jgi:hypothetical protein
MVVSSSKTQHKWQEECHLERKYTKRDVDVYYCHKEPLADQSLQCAGGWLVVQKTAGIMAFMKQWQEGLSNYTLLDDSPSQLPNIHFYLPLFLPFTMKTNMSTNILVVV